MLKRLCKRIRDDENKVIRDAQDHVEYLARLVVCENEDTHGVTGHDFQAEYDEARQYLHLVLETNASYRQDTQFDKYVQDSERSTSFFFRPPTSHLRRTPIESVTLQDGTESSDANVISLEFAAHWGRIMGVGEDTTPTPSMVQAQDQLLQSISRTLTTDQQASLDAPLTEAEIEMAIKSMPGHKAPGPDGFTAAFYQIAPASFAKILLKVFQYQLGRGQLLPKQRKSCAVLLHKKGPRSVPGNYRPIALVQVDVKILSRVLTSRLRSVLNVLIDPDQTGFVRGRSITISRHCEISNTGARKTRLKATRRFLTLRRLTTESIGTTCFK